MSLLPEILITELDTIDIEAMRLRLKKVRSEIVDSTEIDRNYHRGSTTFILPDRPTHRGPNASPQQIEFIYLDDRIIMERGPTYESRSMTVGECRPFAYGHILESPSTKKDFLALVDRWLAMLKIKRHYAGALASEIDPCEQQRILAASYVHAVHPEEKSGHLVVPIRSPYAVPPAEISYDGSSTYWLDPSIARQIIDQTPICVQLSQDSNTYNFKKPTENVLLYKNDTSGIERMRLIADMEGIDHPIRKTKPKG